MKADLTSFDDDEDGCIMTKKALQLSLSPPRCPPFGTAHRKLLAGVKPLDDPYAEHYLEEAHSVYNHHSGVREGLMHLIYNADLPGKHPHLILGPEGGDHITRFLGSLLPLRWQNHVRDTGGFRSIFDSVVECSIPLGAVANPGAALSFLKLSKQCQKIHYGPHDSQFIDFFATETPVSNWKGMIFFVHGGAWGSGKPWHYRLVAQSFLDLGLAVAIVGYRVFPDGDTSCQIQDLQAAHEKLSETFPNLCGHNRCDLPVGCCVVGHSSGAHIALLMLVEQAKRLMMQEPKRTNESNMQQRKSLIDRFIGISGPYDIGHHFDYEAARGVEELSPMKAANGHTRDQFRHNSPCLRLQDFLSTYEESQSLGVGRFFPSQMLMVHGIEDDTVPFTATSEAAQILRSCGVSQCSEVYVPSTGHQDAVIHLMLGGRVKTAIRKSLLRQTQQMNPRRSKL